MKRLVLTERDLAIFRYCWMLRLLTMGQIRSLCYFQSDSGRYSHPDIVRKRLSRLEKAGYLIARDILQENAMSMQRVFALGPAALEPLNHRYGIQQRRLYHAQGEHALAFAHHTLWISTFVEQLTESFRARPNVAVPDLPPLNIPFIHTHAVADATKRKHTQRFVSQENIELPDGTVCRIRPDLVFALRSNGGARLFFLEADRGTEGRLQILDKQTAYHHYLTTRDPRRQDRFLWQRYGKVDSFRVLFVTTTEGRIKGLRRFLMDKPGFDLLAFTTLDAVRHHDVLFDCPWHLPNGSVGSLLKGG